MDEGCRRARPPRPERRGGRDAPLPRLASSGQPVRPNARRARSRASSLLPGAVSRSPRVFRFRAGCRGSRQAPSEASRAPRGRRGGRAGWSDLAASSCARRPPRAGDRLDRGPSGRDSERPPRSRPPGTSPRRCRRRRARRTGRRPLSPGGGRKMHGRSLPHPRRGARKARPGGAAFLEPKEAASARDFPETWAAHEASPSTPRTGEAARRRARLLPQGRDLPPGPTVLVSAGRCWDRAPEGTRPGAACERPHPDGRRSPGARLLLHAVDAPGPGPAPTSLRRRRSCRLSSLAPEFLLRKDDVFERPQERGTVVQSGCPAEVRDPGLLRCTAKELIDLVERLDVVRHEGDRDGENLLFTFSPELADGIERGRAQPFDGPEPGLIGQSPGTLSARLLVDRPRARLDLSLIRVAFPRHESLGNGVGRKEQPHGFGTRVGKLRDLFPDSFGVRLDEERMRRPGADLEEPGAWGIATHRLPRALERSLGGRERIVRIERQREESPHSGTRELSDDILDERRGAIHRGSSDRLLPALPQEPLDPGSLFLGEPPDWRASADGGIQLPRRALSRERDGRGDGFPQDRRTHPNDIGIGEEPVEKAGDLVQILRTAELQEEDRTLRS